MFVFLTSLLLAVGTLQGKPFHSSGCIQCFPGASTYSGHSSGGSASYSSFSSSSSSSQGGSIVPVGGHSASLTLATQHSALPSGGLKHTFEHLKQEADAFISKAKDDVSGVLHSIPSPIHQQAEISFGVDTLSAVPAHSSSSFHKEVSGVPAVQTFGSQYQSLGQGVSFGSAPSVHTSGSSLGLSTGLGSVPQTSHIITESKKTEHEKKVITSGSYGSEQGQIGGQQQETLALTGAVSKPFSEISGGFQQKDKYQDSSSFGGSGSTFNYGSGPSGAFVQPIQSVPSGSESFHKEQSSSVYSSGSIPQRPISESSGSAYSSQILSTGAGSPLIPAPVGGLSSSSSYKEQSSSYSGGSIIPQQSTGLGLTTGQITISQVPVVAKVTTFTQPAVVSSFSSGGQYQSGSGFGAGVQPIIPSTGLGSSTYKKESKYSSSHMFSEGSQPIGVVPIVRPEKIIISEVPLSGQVSSGSGFTSGGGFSSGSSYSSSSSFQSASKGAGGYVSQSALPLTAALDSGSAYTSLSGGSQYGHSGLGGADSGIFMTGSLSGAPGHKSYQELATSFSSKSHSINGQKTENRHAAVMINDNGNVETYEKSSKK